MCVHVSRPGTGSIAAGAFTHNGIHECQVFMWEEPKLWTITATRKSQKPETAKVMLQNLCVILGTGESHNKPVTNMFSMILKLKSKNLGLTYL